MLTARISRHPARTSFTMHSNTRRTDAAAAFARLLPRGDSTFPGAARHAILVPVEHDGRRWLVAPYGPVSWVHNARAAGRVTLTRRRDTRQYAIREVAPEQAGHIPKRYVRIATAARRYFLATKDSPVEDFVTGRPPPCIRAHTSR